MTPRQISTPALTRRNLLAVTGASGVALALPASALAAILSPPTDTHGATVMTTIKTRDGTEIFYKDWGPKDAQPIVFHHGWPLTGDDWDNQMLFFLGQGFRVIAHDRRGHGRSAQTDTGNDMDHYAAEDRKSTRLNSSHVVISYAVFCLKKKKKQKIQNIVKSIKKEGNYKQLHRKK
mgnify:CR=1 FL=1